MSWKNRIFRLLGKEPEAVVVSFCSGPEALGRAMVEQVKQLVPDREHFAVAEYDVPGVRRLHPDEARDVLRSKRIGLAPTLFGAGREYGGLRRLAFHMAPAKVLAYNPRLERHHLRLRTPVASLLFLRGVPLDRIWLRPSWLLPFKHDRTVKPQRHEVFEGRPLQEGRPRVAVLSPYFPYPLSHGGAVRIFNLLREAAQHFDVFLFAFSEEGAIAESSPVLDLCTKVVLFPNPRYREPRWATLRPPEVNEFQSNYVAAVLDDFRRRYNFKLTQVEYTQLAGYRGDVLVEHDVTFDLYKQIHERERTLRSWWDLYRWRRWERTAISRFARVVVMSEKDASLLGTRNTAVIPNGVDLSRFRPEPELPGRRILFVGSFAHFPNVVAYRFFAEEVLPLLSDGGLRFTVIAGRNPELYHSEPPPDSRIEFHGFIADVRPFYAAANLVVVPTRVSAGTNLKVLEAMAMERAVLSTPSGCAGLDLVPGESVWVAETAEELARAAEHLLSDEDLRRQLAQTARRVATERYSWDRIGRAQRQLWNEVISGIVVRNGSRADAWELERIQQASHGASQWEPDSYFRFDVKVAMVGSSIGGFMVTRTVAFDEAEILNIAVAPESRRRGVATALIESLNVPEVFLEVRESNDMARGLYEKLGFREAGRREEYYDDPVESAIIMRRGSHEVK